MKVLLKRVGATGHPVDPENPPFGFSVWRSHEKMAHGREMAQVHEGSQLPLMQTHTFQTPYFVYK